jgi:hypothetical protein
MFSEQSIPIIVCHCIGMDLSRVLPHKKGLSLISNRGTRQMWSFPFTAVVPKQVYDERYLRSLPICVKA